MDGFRNSGIVRLLSSLSLLGIVALAVAQNPPADVIRINVNLVQVDAVVNDAQGRLVEDLKQGDFEILQDGKPQAITNFSYINTRPSGSVAQAPAAPPRGRKPGFDPTAPPPVPVRPEQARRAFALVVDDLAIGLEDVGAVRAAVARFVDREMQPGDTAAVIRTGAGLGALEQFTSDKHLLHLALNHIQYNVFGREGLEEFVGDDDGMGLNVKAESERSGHSNEASLGAIATVVNGLKELPGRKTVILFSSNLALTARGVPDPRAGGKVTGLADAASRASVVISSIDPRGLKTQRISSESQGAMFFLAQATGGTFTESQNDLGAALHRVVEDSSGYYLIGYHPPANTFEPKTGQLLPYTVAVRVTRPGLQVRSRTGFIGDTGTPQPARALSPQAEMVHALTSPFGVRGVHVRMTALFAHNARQGSSINALLYIDAKDLKFETQSDGTRKAVIEILSATFTEGEKVLDPVAEVCPIVLRADRYQQALRSGFTYTHRHPVKKPGGYQMRIAIRDASSRQIGSASQFIEVPDVARGRLALSSITIQDAASAGAAKGQGVPANPLGSASDRSFVGGEPVLYALTILNARRDAAGQPQLEIEERIFREGAQIAATKPHPADVAPQADANHLRGVGQFRLGAAMKPGDYVLQVIVTDKLAAAGAGVASQWMDFEVRQ